MLWRILDRDLWYKTLDNRFEVFLQGDGWWCMDHAAPPQHVVGPVFRTLADARAWAARRARGVAA